MPAATNVLSPKFAARADLNRNNSEEREVEVEQRFRENKGSERIYEVGGSTPKLQLTYEADALSNIYTNGLRVQKTEYPASPGSHNSYSYDTPDSIHDRLHRVQIVERESNRKLNGACDV